MWRMLFQNSDRMGIIPCPVRVITYASTPIPVGVDVRREWRRCVLVLKWEKSMLIFKAHGKRYRHRLPNEVNISRRKYKQLQPLIRAGKIICWVKIVVGCPCNDQSMFLPRFLNGPEVRFKNKVLCHPAEQIEAMATQARRNCEALTTAGFTQAMMSRDAWTRTYPRTSREPMLPITDGSMTHRSLPADSSYPVISYYERSADISSKLLPRRLMKARSELCDESPDLPEVVDENDSSPIIDATNCVYGEEITVEGSSLSSIE